MNKTLQTMPAPFLQAVEQSLESVDRSHSFGKVAADISFCDEHLHSDVTLHLSFVRSKSEFALIFDGDAKSNKITLSLASFYVWKLTVSDLVSTAIEKTLTKTPALYLYSEVLVERCRILQEVAIGVKGMPSAMNQSEVLLWFSLLFRLFWAPKLQDFSFIKIMAFNLTAYHKGYSIARNLFFNKWRKASLDDQYCCSFFGHYGHGIRFH